MKLIDLLLQPPTSAQRNAVVNYVGTNSSRFNELIQTLINGPARITQRATWPMSYCVEKHPGFIKPHFNTVTKLLEDPDLSVTVKRNLLRMLQFVSIPVRFQGRMADCCFGFLANKKETVAVKAFSMTVLANLAVNNKELSNEIIPLIEEQLPYGSAGFISRARKVLKQLK